MHGQFARHDKELLQTAAQQAAAKFMEITLKALANSSPGFALKRWVLKWRKRFFATLKELRRRLRIGERRCNPDFVGVLLQHNCVCDPRVAKAQPWAGIGERCQRYKMEGYCFETKPSSSDGYRVVLRSSSTNRSYEK